MKIYISHSTGFDFKNELYGPIRKSKLNSEYVITLPHETDQFINSKETIVESSVVIAEVSYPSTGSGIELGWAIDAEVPIICVYKEGSKISSSLKAISNTFISYKDGNDLIEKLDRALKSL